MIVQKNFRRIRIVVALLVIIGELVLFADSKGKLPSNLFTTIHYLQFVPSILNAITPGTLLSIGFIIILGLTVFSGRVYCSLFCPLGIIQDVFGWIRQKIKPQKRNKFTRSLNYIRYPILVLCIISLFFTGILLLNLFDPYANFGRIASNLYQPVFIGANNVLAKLSNSFGMYFLFPIESKHIISSAFIVSLVILMIVLVFSVFKGRLYCNTICPVGAFLGLVSKISFYKIKIDAGTCTKCGKCQAACKANCLDIKSQTIDETRCVSCFNCLTDCESDSITYKNAWNNSKPAQQLIDTGKRNLLKTGVFSLLAVTGINPVLKGEGGEGHGHGNGHGHGKKKRRFWNRGVATPPGSLSLERFKDKCIACHLCVTVCPGKVLQPTLLEYGIKGMLLPKMDYALGYCNYECIKCGEVCPTGAILQLPVEEKKLTQLGEVIFVKKHCIVESEGTACGSCSEHCPTQAVKMVDYVDDLTIPEVDPSICIGCGACEYACPVTDPHKAIFVMPNNEHILAEKPEQEAVEVEETEEFPF